MSVKTGRLLEIINFLLSNGKVKISTLAAEFGVSRVTMNQYIVEISGFCAIATYRGRCGGVEINKSSTLGGRYWNRVELKTIHKALYSQFLVEPDNLALGTIIKKFDVTGLYNERLS